MEIDLNKINKRFYPLIAAGLIAAIFIIRIFFQNLINWSPEKVFTRYIKFQRTANYKKAYNTCFSSSYKKRFAFSSFEAFQKDVASVLGITINKETIEKRKLMNKKGHNLSIIVAMGLYPRGAVPENYFFIKELSGWKIDGFDLQSHLLDHAERARMRDFVNNLPPEVREGYERMLESQARPVKN